MKLFDLKFFKLFLVLIVALAICIPSMVTAKEYKFACSLGWMENESGQRFRYGYEAAVKELGGKITFTDANYDPKKQSDQIEAFIKMKPDALFITASDPAGILQAVKRAVAAGIPVFTADTLIPGADAVTAVASNNFGMGMLGIDYIAKKLNGRGNIGFIDLPSNEAWDLRGQGARWALKTKYPDIKIVAKWSWDSTGAVTPRQAVDNMLTAHPNKGDLDAIWCAWDGAAMEGAHAIKAAGRENEIFTTGIDGGKAAFGFIKADMPFNMTLTQSFYTMTYMGVYYAHKYLAGEQVPRTVITPVYTVTKDTLEGIKKPEEYDIPGVAGKFGWKRDL